MEQIKLREFLQEEVHNMRPSAWAVYGIYIVFGFVLIILAASYFIQYPDIVISEACFESSNPSVTLPARSNSKIITIRSKDGSRVHKGDLIAILNTNSNYEDVFHLLEVLDKYKIDKDWLSLFEDLLGYDPQLGSMIQGAYNELMLHLLEFYKITKLSSVDKQIARLKEEAIYRREICHNFNSIEYYNDSIEAFVANRTDIDSVLYSDSYISKLQYENTLQGFLESKKGFIQEKLGALQNDLQLIQVNNSIENLIQIKEETLLQLEVNINISYTNLMVAIALWQEGYVIRSPIDGLVCFLKPLKLNQYVSQEEPLITVLPDSVSYVVNLRIPFSGAGKIKKGQRVNIKLNDYPYTEYGFIEGKLINISNVANDDHYIGVVQLNNNNFTAYDKEIVIKEKAMGIAEIITNDRSWLGRIFEKFVYIIKR